MHQICVYETIAIQEGKGSRDPPNPTSRELCGMVPCALSLVLSTSSGWDFQSNPKEIRLLGSLHVGGQFTPGSVSEKGLCPSEIPGSGRDAAFSAQGCISSHLAGQFQRHVWSCLKTHTLPCFSSLLYPSPPYFLEGTFREMTAVSFTGGLDAEAGQASVPGDGFDGIPLPCHHLL